MSTTLSEADDGDQAFPVVEVPPDIDKPEPVVRYILSQFPHVVGHNFEAALINWRRREELGSTNVGRGIAVPEVVGKFVNQSAIIAGILAAPIEWPGTDEVRRVFLIVCQEQSSVLPLLEVAARQASANRADSSE